MEMKKKKKITAFRGAYSFFVLSIFFGLYKVVGVWKSIVGEMISSKAS